MYHAIDIEDQRKLDSYSVEDEPDVSDPN